MFFFGEEMNKSLRYLDYDNAQKEALGNTLIYALGCSIFLTTVVIIIHKSYKAIESSLLNPKVDEYKTTINWTYKQFTLTHPQKTIWSVTSLFTGFMIALAMAKEINHKEYFSDAWFIWVIAALIEAWLQNKIWSEHFQFKYPSGLHKSKEVNSDELPF